MKHTHTQRQNENERVSERQTEKTTNRHAFNRHFVERRQLHAGTVPPFTVRMNEKCEMKNDKKNVEKQRCKEHKRQAMRNIAFVCVSSRWSSLLTAPVKAAKQEE